MSTVGDELDLIQERLHDGGVIWPRSELLKLWNDWYGGLVLDSACVRRLTMFDLPPTTTWSVTYEWEAQMVTGTVRKLSRTVAPGQYQATSLWEVEQVAGGTITASWGGITQEWEREYLSPDDRQYKFVFPRRHSHILGLYFDDVRLEPIGIRSLDETDGNWYAQGGRPRWWTTGTGPNRTVEVYAIQTGIQQGYAYAGTAPYGIPRQITGTRSYTVSGTTGIGLIRSVLSPDHQYWPAADAEDATGSRFLGRIVEWRSSGESVMAIEVVGPERDLEETDTPAMLPAQALKYVRFGVLSRCFARQGEGYQPILRDHFKARYERGVAFLKRLVNLPGRDRVYQRQTAVQMSRLPARPRLPDEYERVTP